MSLQSRISDLTLRVAQEFNSHKGLINSKLDSNQGTANGYVKTDSLGNIVVIEESHVPSAPLDGSAYLLQNNLWVPYVPVSTLTWGQITDKPVEFPPTDHNHNTLYYAKTEVDNALILKSDIGHTHDERYHLKTEITTLLDGKENVFVKNTAFNKNFGVTSGTVSEGDHNHNTLYYTKPEVTTLLAGKSNTGHNHNTLYYTKPEVDTLLSSSNLGTSHNHDVYYYRKTEVDTLLQGKSNVGHLHDDRYYLKTTVDGFLSNKSDIGHNHDDRYYTETEIDSMLDAITTGADITTPAGGIPVILSEGKTFGKYINGDTIPGGLNVLQVIQQAVTEVIPPDWFYPTTDLTTTADISVNREVGEPLPHTVQVVYTQNDGGAAISYAIYKNEVEVVNSPTISSYDDPGFVVLPGTTSYRGETSFEAGTGTKLNSVGDSVSNPIQAGVASSDPVIITGYYPIFYGPTPTVLTTGQEFRNTLTKVLDTGITSITLNTGIDHNIFQVWLPTGRAITQVIDLDAMNVDITSVYVSSSVSGVDAGGNTITGTLYTCSNDTPYLQNHRHLISLG